MPRLGSTGVEPHRRRWLNAASRKLPQPAVFGVMLGMTHIITGIDYPRTFDGLEEMFGQESG